MTKWETTELQRSWDRGVWDRWDVLQRHEVGDSWVWFTYEQARIYAPLEHAELPHQLAAAIASDAALSTFVGTYGRLGWQELADGEARGGNWLQEQREVHDKLLNDRAAQNPGDFPGYLEPREWIDAHARTVAWCLLAAHALRFEPSAKQRRALAVVADSIPKPWGIRASLGHGDFLSEGLREKVSLRDYVGGVLEDVLWVNLRGVRRRVKYSQGTLRTMWGGASLIESIYSLVADSVTGGRLAQCQAKDCGAIFVQTDNRQRFCPPPEGVEKSRCMNRTRTGRQRKAENDDGVKR